ncbi:hypothetical protein OG470_22450 [Micromonospora sp. NBC_00389]|uniref:hypothetical protein n=1 Tax=Micromonospora sp. NBC_00389 TaxID=2903586 RepID=UPI002E21823F
MSTEFDYLGDAKSSKLFDLVLQLATDLHVTRQRLRAVEALLVRGGHLDGDAVDGFTATPAEQPAFNADRDGLQARLLRILTEDGPAEHPLRNQWEAAIETRSR